jgi:hypothetical protein
MLCLPGEVIHTFFGIYEVSQGVFRSIQPTGKAKYKQRRVVIDDIEIAEWRKVGALSYEMD